MKNLVRITQTIKQVNKQYFKTKTVWDLGLQKMIGEAVQEDADDQEKKIGEYDMRVDKETYNFFKMQEKLQINYKMKKKKKQVKKDDDQAAQQMSI